MSQPLTIATWNINGIRARLDRLVAWLRSSQVDVLCLQETKTPDDKFPEQTFAELGYHLARHGQKSYNGVALVSKHEIGNVVIGLDDGNEDDQARLISGDIAGVTVMSAYFPNGQAVGSEKYDYKLAWMARLRDRVAREIGANRQIALCGDFNVAPEPRDTYDPAVWEGKILCSDKERDALAEIRDAGLVDALRKARPDDIVFTWWDYRMLAFPKNKGLRIDHVYVTPALAGRVTAVRVDREARKGQQPSDHAPLIVELRA